MVGRIQPTYIIRYPALKAVVDELIELGFGNKYIARRVKTRRPVLRRHRCTAQHHSHAASIECAVNLQTWTVMCFFIHHLFNKMAVFDGSG